MGPGSVEGRERKYAFVFVFQQGMLETAALLLVASLKRFLRCDYELIAAVPTPSQLWGEPSETGRRLLEEMGVRVEPFTNEFGRSRPNTNKTYCLQVPTDADKLILLDSDIFCLREFSGGERFDIPLNLVPAYSHSLDEWDDYYGAVGIPMPSLRQPTLLTKEYNLPWFNSGIVAVDSDVPLGKVWLESEKTLVADESVDVGPRQLQISLALSVQRIGAPYDCLDESYNHPVFAKRIAASDPPYFAHYGHWGGPIVQHDPVLEATAASLVSEQPELLEVMAADGHWSGLAGHFRGDRGKGRGRGGPADQAPGSSPPGDLIITGIASSGAGYLSDLIGAYTNCVVMRDPGGRVKRGLPEPVPWPLAIFYGLERMRILGGAELIPSEALLADPGAEAPEVEVPPVESADFVLATTSTHRYLERLDGLRRVLPHARIVVCVRDPFDTIASWKRYMEEHPDEDLRSSALAPQIDDPWLTMTQRENVALLHEADLPEARAMVWQHFAELILNQLDRVTLVRFDELIRAPERVVEEVLRGLDAGRSGGAIDPPRASGERSGLDEADEQAIRAICTQAAFELGLRE